MNYGRRNRVADAFRLWFAQVLIDSFRLLFRFMEVFGPEKRRPRLRAFREKMQALDEDRNSMLQKMESSSGWEKFEAFDEFLDRHADFETQQRFNEMRVRRQEARKESEALKAIGIQSGEDTAEAIEGYRNYIESHPDSDFAYFYLGIALQKNKDWDASRAAYQEAERLAADNVVFSSSAQLYIGRVLQDQGDLEAASAQYRRIIELQSAEPETRIRFAYLYLGDILNEQGKRREARSAWKQAAKRDITGLMANMVNERLKANP